MFHVLRFFLFLGCIILEPEAQAADVQSINATVVALSGNPVKISKSQPNISIPLKKGDTVNENDTIITKENEKIKIVTSDYIIVTVIEKSSFQLQSVFSQSKKQSSARLSLLVGKLWLKMKSQSFLQNTNIVITSNATAGVRGTEFAIAYDSQTKKTQSWVLQGSIIFGGNKGSVVVSEGFSSTLEGSGQPSSPVKIENDMIQNFKDEQTVSLNEDTKDSERAVLEMIQQSTHDIPDPSLSKPADSLPNTEPPINQDIQRPTKKKASIKGTIIFEDHKH